MAVEACSHGYSLCHAFEIVLCGETWFYTCCLDDETPSCVEEEHLKGYLKTVCKKGATVTTKPDVCIAGWLAGCLLFFSFFVS